MKAILLTITAVVLGSTLLWGQTTNLPPGVVIVPSIRALPVTPAQTNDSRQSFIQTNVAGLSLNPSGRAEQRILPAAGGARAEFGLQKTFFPLDVRGTDPVMITAPDGRHLSFRATFLALYNTSSGQSLLLAEVTNQIGAILGDDQVIYTNAFDSLHADIRYRYTKYSLEQDIILHERPTLPAEFAPENTRLEIWTEWFDSQPVSLATQAIDLRGNDTTGLLTPSLANDDGVDFGTMKIVAGHAFSSTAQDERTPVSKRWVRIEGRDWLIETVDYLAVRSRLELLPRSRRSASYSHPSSEREAMIRSLARQSIPTPRQAKQMRTAQVRRSNLPEFVMDFIIVSSVPAPEGIISWWPAGSPNDVIGANHVTLANGAGYSAGKVGQGFSLDGIDDRITAPDSSTLDFGALADFTIEAWIKPVTYAADYQVNTIVSKRYSPNTYTTLGYELYLNDGKLALRLDDPSNKYYFPTTVSSPNLRDGNFHHVAVTVVRDSSTGLKFYIDGVEVETFDPTVSPGDLSNTEPLRIGNHPTPGLNCFFKGVIDEPAIYDRALGADEIQAIYEAGAAGKHNPTCVNPPTEIVAWWPGDGNNYDLARTNFAVLSGASYAAAAVSDGFSFNGSSAGVTAPHDSALDIGASDNITIEAWIKPLANTTTYGVMSVAGKRYSPTSTSATGYELFLVNGVPGFQMANASGVYNFIAAGDLRASGGYHHVVVTLDRSINSGLRIYVNGNLAADPFNPMVLSGSLANTDPFRIGVHPQTGFNGWYKGIIDEVTVYRRALTSSEVISLYTAGSAGKCKVDSDNDGLTDLQEDFLDTNPEDADSDNDNLTDGDEVFVHHTDPLDDDMDGDGLNDGYELLVSLTPPTDPDADYDGVLDGQEVTDATLPNNASSVYFQNRSLGHWRFNNTSWQGEQGQLPISPANLQSVASWNGNAVRINNVAASNLKYRDFELNGQQNIFLRQGTVRFWFKPDWSSTGVAGGTGPGGATEARLVDMGTATTAWWVMTVSPDGTLLKFSTKATGQSVQTKASAQIQWKAGEWYQVTLVYNSARTAFYIDGKLAGQSVTGVSSVPSRATRVLGFRIGSDSTGQSQAKGSFDELETFNHPLSTTRIEEDYQAAISAPQTGAPVILHQPESLTKSAGQGATFKVVATGAHPLTYQWYHNSVVIPNATSPTYTIPSVLASHAGTYKVKVTNPVNVVDSTTVNLTVPFSVALGNEALNYVIGSTPKRIASLATIASAPANTGSGGTLVVTVVGNVQTRDTLYVNHEGNGTEQIGVSGTTITYEGSTIGTLNSINGGVGTTPLTITFSPNVAMAKVQALIRSLTFHFYPDTPNNSQLPRTINVQLNASGQSTASAMHVYLSCPAALDVMLVLDRSNSIGEDFPAVQNAAISFIEQLEGQIGHLINDQVGLVSFHSTASINEPYGHILTHDGGEVKELINELATSSGTDIAGGIEKARLDLRLPPDGHHNADSLPIIILLTDGDQSVTGDPVLQARLAKNMGIRVITIGLGDDLTPSVLKQMASYAPSDSGGDYYGSPEPEDLAGIYQKIGFSVCREAPNSRPVVTVTPPTQTIAPGAQASFTVTATDDNLPVTPLITGWTVTDENPPGTVTFSGSGPTYNATFSAPGVYHLSFSASDSQYTASDDATVTVSGANQAPTVNAGPDQTIVIADGVYLPGTVSDDGQPLTPGKTTVTWSKQSGPDGGVATFDDEHSATTMANFNKPGTYVLRLEATDGELNATPDTTTIVVTVSTGPNDNTEIIRNAEVVSAGVGGLKDNFGESTITIEGIRGTVKKAYLVWQGPSDSFDPDANAAVIVNDRHVIGKNMEIAGTGGAWESTTGHFLGNSHAYRADITSLVAAYGNGTYRLSGMTKPYELRSLGASLIVFFYDSASSSRQDFLVWTGNDNNGPEQLYIHQSDGSDYRVNSIALDSSGKAVIGGWFGFNALGYNFSAIARIAPTWKTDLSFDPEVVLQGSEVNQVLVQADGKIVLAGDLSSCVNCAGNAIIRLNANGTQDTTFAAESINHQSPPFGAKAVLPQGNSYVIGGRFDTIGAQSVGGIARLDSNGDLDSNFNPGTGAENGDVQALAIQGNGIIVGGKFTTFDGSSVNRLVRLNSNGSVDSTFTAPPEINGDVFSVAVLQSGKLLVGGSFTKGLLRLNANGTLDSTFNSAGAGAGNTVRAIVEQTTDQKILIGGIFTTYNGENRSRLARLNSDGTLDGTLDPAVTDDSNVTSVNTILRLADGRVLIGGDFSSVQGRLRYRIARLNSDLTVDTSAEPNVTWKLELPINYTGGNASLELHVSDGEYDHDDKSYWDPTLFLNGKKWWEGQDMVICGSLIENSAQIWTGSTASYDPNDVAECRGLWDIREKPINSILSPSATSLLLTNELPGYILEQSADGVNLVVAIAKLPLGAPPENPPVEPPANLPPVIRDDNVTVHRGVGVKMIDVLGNDTYFDGKYLTISSVSTPDHGRAEILHGGTVILYEASRPAENATFTYTAVDQQGNSGTATVHIQMSDDAEPISLRPTDAQAGSLDLATSPSVTAIRGLGQKADFYRFSGTKGCQVTVNLLDATFHSHVYLRDPRGNLVISGNHFWQDNHPQPDEDILDSSCQVVLPMTGDYSIEVTSHSAKESGNYLLSLETQCQEQASVQVLVDGVVIPSGGKIHFGTDLVKQIEVRNIGNQAYGDFSSSTYGSFQTPVQFATPTFPPNATASFEVEAIVAEVGAIQGHLALAEKVGSSTFHTRWEADLVGYVNPTGPLPQAAITAPRDGHSINLPSNVEITATAIPPSGRTITKVKFYANSNYGRTEIGEKTSAPYTATFVNPSAGNYTVTAWAYDDADHIGVSAPIRITASVPQPNVPPVAVNDYQDVAKRTTDNCGWTRIDVLGNDHDPNGDLLVVTEIHPQNGDANIIEGGRAIEYCPDQDAFGEDIITYTVSDGRKGTATAKVYVNMVQTLVEIIGPDPFDSNDPVYHPAEGDITITATAETSHRRMVKVEFFEGNRKLGERLSTSSPYEFEWENVPAGIYALRAVAHDESGFTVSSSVVNIRVGNAQDPPPIAAIANLANSQVIREGAFQLYGTASYPPETLSGDVTYWVSLYRPDDGMSWPDERLVATLIQPITGSPIQDGALGQLDFSSVRNGSYILELAVSKNGHIAYDQVRIILESNLKVGHFTFSEQDVALPVSGMPLTVVRTYDSSNPNRGEFGYAWTFSLVDMEAEINEDRAEVLVQAPDGEDVFVNARIGGGRDVTLTLPDGRRTTFLFTPVSGTCGEDDPVNFCFYAKWQAAPGVRAKLGVAEGESQYVGFWAGLQYWSALPNSDPEMFDFSVFYLTNEDGTIYTLEREYLGEGDRLDAPVGQMQLQAFGKLNLTKITTLAGDEISIQRGSGSTTIQHFPAGGGDATRSISVEYNPNGTISAVRDPMTPTGRAAVKYDYDSKGNLWKVHRLVDKNATAESAAYATTEYVYNDPEHPRVELDHYITKILDPRGIPAARNKYDTNGKLLEMTDAAGNVTKFDHDLVNRREIITDALNHVTVHEYDARGNVLSTRNALGQVVTRTYDLKNNLLTESDTARKVTTHTYDERNRLASTTDPANNTQSFTYEELNGQIKTITDAMENVTVNTYDPATGNLTDTVQPLSVTTQYEYYSGTRLLWKVVDPQGNKTVFVYDGMGNIVSEQVQNSSGTVLSETLYPAGDYDGNGNRTKQIVNRLIPGQATQGQETTFEYDNQNRLIRTTDPLNGVTETIYNSTGKAEYMIDRYQRTTRHFFDAMGRVVQTLYADGTITRTVYDKLGRVVVATDRHSAPVAPFTSQTITGGNGTVYDAIGRVETQQRLTNVTIHLIEQPASSGVYTSVLDQQPDVVSSTGTGYDEAGRVKSSADARGNVTHFDYDDTGRRTSVRDALGSTTRFGYDKNGNQLWFEDALKRTIDYVYDDLNRRTEVHYPLAAADGGVAPVQYTKYDDLGRRWLEIDLGGVATAYVYDSLGRLSWVITDVENTKNVGDLLPFTATRTQWETWARGTRGVSDSTATHYAYDSLGNLLMQGDAEGRQTTYEYDKLGRRTDRTLPGTQSESVAYQEVDYLNTPGQPKVLRKKITDFKGDVVYHLHDLNDRLVEKIVDPEKDGPNNNSPVVEYSYFADGKRYQMADPTGITTYDYNALGLLHLKELPFLNGSLEIRYDYDSAGNLTGLSNPNGYISLGYTATYSWDELNRLRSAAPPAIGGTAIPVTYTYDVVGNLAQSVVHYPNLAITNAYTYDERNRLTGLVATRKVSGTVTPLATFNYDPVGRRLHPTGARMAARETIYAATTINRAVDYSYNPLYRLNQENIVSGTPVGAITYDSTPGYSDNTSGYGYDKVGNRRSRTSPAALQSVGVSDLFDQDFDDNDWLTTDTYDNNGNTKVGTVGAGAVVPSGSYPDVYDFENRLIQRRNANTIITLTYDGDGNLVAKTVTDGGVVTTTRYIVDDRNPTGYSQVLAEIGPNGDGGYRVDRRYLYGHDLIRQERLIPTGPYSGDWDLDYYGYDGHGNVRYLVSDNGDITDTYTYDAFGILIAQTPAPGSQTPNCYLYCGERWHADLGLYHLRARYMNPTTGKFWTMDTYEGNKQAPVSIHKYIYAEHDPVNHADPSGHFAELSAVIDTISIYRSLMQISVELPSTLQALEVQLGERVLIERYKKAHAYLESRQVKHFGNVDASCYSVNQPIAKFLGPPPRHWTIRLEHRSQWQGGLAQTLFDHWGIICYTRVPRYREILFDYWGDRPAGENPNAWFRVAFEGAYRDHLTMSFNPNKKAEDYSILDLIPKGAK